jgi:chitinase
MVLSAFPLTTDFSAAKGNFISNKGLKGYSMWHSVGDYKDILIDSINGALGIERC